MKKKTKIPKDPGWGIISSFFEASNQQFGDLLRDLCKGLPEVKEKLKNPETKQEAEWFLSLPEPYTNILLAIGFVLGQKFDLVSNEALNEMDYIWSGIKDKDWFFVYPREGRPEGCLPSMGRKK